MPGEWVDERELRQLEHAKNAEEFSEAQREAVEKVDDVLVMKGSRPGTRTRFARKAKKLAEFLDKPFEEATRDDLASFLAHITETYEPSGVRFVKSFVRRFYTLLFNPYEEELPGLVSWISAEKPNADHSEPDPILQPEDVEAMIEAARCQRDRAIIAVLYESGVRVSELCGLTVDDVELDQYGAKITVDGKTGIRTVRLIQSTPELRDWLNLHQHTDSPGAPLWTRRIPRSSSKPLLQSGIRRVLQKAGEDAGVDKPVNPHAFRKARATHLSKRLTPSELSVYFGWVQGSTMPQVYIHLSGDDVEKKLLKQAGKLEEDDDQGQALQTQTCPRCSTDNGPTAKYCTQCTLPLSDNERRELAEQEELLQERLPKLLELLNDPEVTALLEEKTQKMTG